MKLTKMVKVGKSTIKTVRPKTSKEVQRDNNKSINKGYAANKKYGVKKKWF